MDTPYQPTGSGKWIWRRPLTRDVVEFGTLPDPRDARIAELEARVAELEVILEYAIGRGDYLAGEWVKDMFPSPEGEMRVTQEAMHA